MSKLLGDIVRFRGDKLFNGAVSIDWIETDEAKASAASSAFVFHGPAYHGVTQTDIGISHGHSLQDTASFVKAIFYRCYGLEEQPFTLAIAGYGTGKSHLGLTLGRILGNPTGKEADDILLGIESADQEIAATLKTLIAEVRQPCLVVALNGMQSFDLVTEVSRQIMNQVKKHDLDSRPLDDLRPRFTQASSLIQMAAGNKDVVDELLIACDAENIDDVLQKLKQQDEITYSRVYKVLASRNIKISALGGESVRDVIDVASREYCGVGKTFKCIAILFDEFGRYTEFATVKSHVAGSGVLQDMFEAIQSNTSKACFVGFIQFELNAYIQRVATEHRNEILRYVTRYQTASKVYLSINLETLIASLIEKNDQGFISQLLDSDSSEKESELIIDNIAKWFPVSQNHRIWKRPAQFHGVIRKGCWPLSPYSVWLLFHLAAAGKHLQERSVLALLGDAFDRYKDREIESGKDCFLVPVDFWSEALQQELITSEEGGQQGAITHSYSSVMARHGAQLPSGHLKLLRAVVLASKLGMKSNNQDEATRALSEFTGLQFEAAHNGLRLLREEFNIIEWDEAFKQFDILGDAVPRTQFLSYIRQRVASTFDETGKASLFSNKAADWCDVLSDLDCDFAEENKITTKEWRYQSVTSNLDVLPMHIKLASDRWANATSIDDPRGTIIYCYVEPSRNINTVERDVSLLLRTMSKGVGATALPILIVLLSDDDGKLGQSLAELSIVEDDLNPQDVAKFGNLIPAHKQKMLDDIKSRVEGMIKRRLYVTAFKEPLESTRLGRVGSDIFSKIYKSPITFPFDGFTTIRGNAATTCQIFTAELLQGRLDWNSIMAKPAKDQNRAVSVLRESWGIFAKNGSVRTRPEHPVLRGLTEKWDEQLANGEKRILLQDAMKRICAPPYGANIASAGLFLGMFIAPRIDKLSIIKSKRSISITEWIQEGIFRGSFVDISSFHDVELMFSGKSSSEWENLLDEWEQAETYSSQRDWYIRAEELKNRVPLPPSQAYREIHLESIGKTAFKELKKNEEIQDAAIRKIDNGIERADVSLLSWGAADLVDLIARMTSKVPLWSDHEIEKIKLIAERSRQSVIHIFPDWIKRQTPKDVTPDSVGEFKHKMIHKIGGSLEKLKLDELQDELVKYTTSSVRKVELIATAHQLVGKINLWITSHAQATNFIRVAELRALQKVGTEYSNKLRGLSTHIEIAEITESRVKLTNRLEEIKQALRRVKDRASNLWQKSLETIDDAETLQFEIDELFSIYEGCGDDIDDLQVMRRALRIYIQAYQQLNNDRLTSEEFDSLANSIATEALDTIGEDDPPWEPLETIENFRKLISKNRAEKSLAWIQDFERKITNLERLNATEANSLYVRANSPPAILSHEHKGYLDKICKRIEVHLTSLKIEWLLAKFRELTPEMQRQFLSRVSR
jgi:hypothetical protein